MPGRKMSAMRSVGPPQPPASHLPPELADLCLSLQSKTPPAPFSGARGEKDESPRAGRGGLARAYCLISKVTLTITL